MSYTNGLDNPELYMQVKLYTGDGSTPSITLDGDTDMQPDFVWIKNRDQTDSHCLFDSVRTATEVLHSDTIDAETTDADTLTSFDSDGFALGADVKVNTNTEAYVAWCWKASGSTASNSSGDITSTVDANTTAGFSIVSYTGDGTAGNTVGHGLNSAPEFILTKARDDGISSWGGYHIGTDATAPEDYIMQIDGTGARIDSSGMLNDTAPTSSLVTLGGETYSNHSSNPMIMYAWHSVQGYSKFSSYTGNGNADGAFVYTGFRPAWVVVKESSGTSNWLMFDNKRDTSNGVDNYVKANANDAENSGTDYMDFLSNGFKSRTSQTFFNESGSTYIYMAFAEAPFVNSNGVPCNAR